jgi:uroporphyrinogen decarboxylase
MADYQLDTSFFQTGEKRYLASLIGVPDRIPVAAQMHEFSMKANGFNAKEFYSRANVFVPCLLENMEKYNIDIPFLDFDIYNIEAEGLGQKIRFSDENMPDIDPHERLIQTLDDIKKIKTPDFESAGRFANVVEMHRLFREMTGTDPVIRFTSPFTLAASIRGIEQLIMDIYDEPQWARDLFAVLTEEVVAPWLLHLKKKFPNAKAISGADAMASVPILSPGMINEWVIPYVLRLIELVGHEVYLPNWTGDKLFKNPEDMFDLKLEVCPGFLEVQDPDLEAIGPGICKAYADKMDVPLVIGLGAVFLALASPEEVFQRVKHYVEIGGKNGRFYLYLCNLGATTPPENVKAAIEAVHAHGTYN